MEQRELLLLEKYAAVNPELKELWEDHILYEKQVEKLEATPTEEQTLKQLKKQKLEGKTRLHAILDGYNEQEGN